MEQKEKQEKRRQEIEENIKKKEAAEEAQRKRERDLETKLLEEQAEQRRIAEQIEKARVETECKARQKELEAKSLAKAKEREQKEQNRLKLKADLKAIKNSPNSVSLLVIPRNGGQSRVVNLGGGSASCASTSAVAARPRNRYPLWLLLTMGLFFLVSTKEFLSRTNKYFAFDRNDKPDLLETLLWGFAALGALWPFYINNEEKEVSNTPKRKF